MPTFVVLLGPPGAGKGTQALRLASSLNVPHVSSGDLFREHFKNQTELGIIAKGYIDRGQLVPDDVTIGMLRTRLLLPDCAGGAILDGFPRTLPQAEVLDRLLAELGSRVSVVIYIRVAEDVLANRLSGRRTCRAQGHSFHVAFNPPKNPGRCDYDDSELYQRPDDMLETVLQRINVYKQQTAPLVEHYRKRDLLREVNGIESIEEVTATVLQELDRQVGV